MSLRLSSLDPNEPRAARDCRTCSRRRVKCDRSLETCRKCALKGLPCPGYGLRIQWGQGVASRGKLTGKAIPVLEAAPAKYQTERNTATSTSSTPYNFAMSPDTIHNKFGLNLDLALFHPPDYVESNAFRDLIHYYDHVVAAVMPWVDGPDNAWRTIMLPLAMESEALLLAILALSAEHYSSKTGSTLTGEHGPLSAHYRERSLQLLAQNLRTELAENQKAHQGPACAMLATILVLCNVEMIHCDSAVWPVHWKAARMITRRWTSSHHPRPTLDSGFRFLIKEAFVYDVFGSTTTFDGEEQIPCSVLDGEDTQLFTQWLQLVQEVTIVERRRHAAMPADQYQLHSADMIQLQKRFKEATESSLLISQSLGFEGLQSDIATLLVLYQQAGLLYSYQALHRKDSALARKDCVESVVDSIRLIQNLDSFQHDLVWPLFLVGTESRNNPSRQKFAESAMLEAMRSTAYSNCRLALEFLRHFWTTDELVVVDWIQFCRQESQKGLSFVVI
ncbi:fungal-specific transcription factor domain-containing protein [Exophiala viscosa]|uniref:fungal-specific transcription factor domain-containing protein n=1 Tax=Exophiala viscosa TaxID=2486360 RepID=UPI00219D8F1A|nr:fungal-specific transcription factor domain-containing protein [Exophiala viscosa]